MAAPYRVVQALLTLVFTHPYRVTTLVRAALWDPTPPQTQPVQVSSTAFSNATHQATRCQLTGFTEATTSLVRRTLAQAEALAR